MTEGYVTTLFPELHEIRNQDLRKKSIQALILAAEKGGWTEETIHLVPVTLNWAGCSCNLIAHSRMVTQVCIDSYQRLAPGYAANGVMLDRDLVVCGALLHDIGKFTEFSLKDGKPVHSETAELLRHPLAGALMANQIGLPDKIVHLIATHSFEGERSAQTPESEFVRKLDMFVFESSVCGLEKIKK